ncbi:aspartate kinase [Psychroserpens sp.]|uniref:aspartate kinase n=1 Tax=Psychroserpens sp. TaxID=2020870 RepID=UPI002AA7D99F|nr:aspartate kinase [Psychroserpens sp.]
MKTIHIIIFGIGNVGSTLITQIIEADARLRSSGVVIKIPIIANSTSVFFNTDDLSTNWQTDFEQFSIPYKMDEILAYIRTQNYENPIVIDATASSQFIRHYVNFVESGCHIVSANKLANTMHYEFYKNLRTTLKKHKKHFHYETNVGAGLPIIGTIKHLYESGERIHRIRGVFSGSLSYVFNRFSSEDESFSKILANASRLGLTEPDAREDLSGNDVARKLLILARELGLKTEFQSIKIESLVPKQLNGKTTVHQFNSRIKELDKLFLKRKLELSENQVLRYVGELDVEANVLEVKLISEASQSVLGQLKGADSIFEIFTESYGEKPLVVQGAGAGRDVTARGVLSDIVKLSSQLN